MSKATPLRALPPGLACNDAMRRAMVISIGGFFAPNLLADFGAVPQLHQSFQFMLGVCGAAGVFWASMALFLGYFHRKLTQAAAFAIAGLSLPYLSTWVWFRITNPSSSAGLLQLFGPAVVVSVGMYIALMKWHAKLSNSTVDVLAEQMTLDDYGEPKARWERVTYRVCQVIGVIVILLLILSAFGLGR